KGVQSARSMTCQWTTCSNCKALWANRRTCRLALRLRSCLHGALLFSGLLFCLAPHSHERIDQVIDRFMPLGLATHPDQSVEQIIDGFSFFSHLACEANGTCTHHRNPRSMRGVASHLRAACPGRGEPSNVTQATAFFFISMGRSPPSPSRQALSSAPTLG